MIYSTLVTIPNWLGMMLLYQKPISTSVAGKRIKIWRTNQENKIEI